MSKQSVSLMGGMGCYALPVQFLRLQQAPMCAYDRQQFPGVCLWHAWEPVKLESPDLPAGRR